MASQPPSASTPTRPSDGMAVSAGLYRAVSRIIRSRDREQLRADPLQLLLLLLFLPEALHHAHAADGLVHQADHLGGLLLRIPARREQPAPGRQRDQVQRGRHREGHDGEHGGQDHHNDQGHHEQCDVPDGDRRHGQQALHHVQVGDGPADQLPGADLVLARAVQPGQRAEQPGPQVVLDVEGQPAAVVAAQVDAGEVHRGRDQQQPGQRPDRLLVGHDDVVDDAALDQRDRGGGHRARQRAADRNDDVAAVTPAVARQPSQPPVSRRARARRVPCPP